MAHRRFDVVVIGAGAMGSSAAYHLASRGYKVLALDRYDIPHEHGSSHGITRIIRLAYFEHPSYVPLLKRSFALWRQLERDSGMALLHVTGSIDAGDVFEGSLNSCELHSLRHEVLTAGQMAGRFPGYRLPAGIMSVFQPDGGFLVPELCVSSHINVAISKGAEVHGREPVLGWEETGSGIAVRTEQGTYEADFAVISAGAWVSKLVPELASIAKPERQVVGWFQPRRPELFTPGNFPVFNLRLGHNHYYGFPVFGVPGFKVGRYHHLHEQVDPDAGVREPDAADERVLRECVERYFPDAGGPTLALHTCLFTNTPDENFILDFHPGSKRVIIASPCSGHGFKFSSVVGEILADFVQHGKTNHDVSMHRMARFGGVAGSA